MGSEHGPTEPLPLESWTGRAWWYGCCGGCCLGFSLLVAVMLFLGMSFFRGSLGELLRFLSGRIHALAT